MDVLGLPRQVAVTLAAITATGLVPVVVPNDSRPAGVALAVLGAVLAVTIAGVWRGPLTGGLSALAATMSLVMAGHVPGGFDTPAAGTLLVATGVVTGMAGTVRDRWRREALATTARARRLQRIAKTGQAGDPRRVVTQARWELGDELGLLATRFERRIDRDVTTLPSGGDHGLRRRRLADRAFDLPQRTAVPVRSHGDLVGHLVLTAMPGTGITGEQIDFVHAVAVQVGAAVAMSPPWRRGNASADAARERMLDAASRLDARRR